MSSADSVELLPAYLMVGTDELKRKTAARRLMSHLGTEFADLNLDEFEGRALSDVGVLHSALETMPFGASFRLVIIHGADLLPKIASEALVTYLADPNPACVLCLEADHLAKNTRLYKAIAKVGERCIIECTLPKRWDLPRYVVRLADARGLCVPPNAAEEFVSRVGDSTVMIDTQLTTLASLIAPRRELTVADVEAYVARTAEVSPWVFLDAVCERRPEKAMELYRLMGHPSLVQLYSLLVGRLRELICAASLAARGASAQLATELDRKDWQVKNHTRWAKRFSISELIGCLDEAATCERALKGSGDAEVAFVRFVLRIAGATGTA